MILILYWIFNFGFSSFIRLTPLSRTDTQSNFFWCNSLVSLTFRSRTDGYDVSVFFWKLETSLYVCVSVLNRYVQSNKQNPMIIRMGNIDCTSFPISDQPINVCMFIYILTLLLPIYTQLGNGH